MKVLLLAIVFGLAVASCGNRSNTGENEQGGYNQGTQQSDTATIHQAPDTAGNK
jgi:hypothetical protein